MCVFIVIEVGSVKSFINVSFLFANTWTIKVFSEYTEKLAEIARKKHKIITIHASLWVNYLPNDYLPLFQRRLTFSRGWKLHFPLLFHRFSFQLCEVMSL